ncbi:MAG TPA: histidine--tRNA ligase [Candidatus Acidoferrales bacterium]|nr:histidine--tRNA ligase [Candidatus Acidoferrales bacterium]
MSESSATGQQSKPAAKPRKFQAIKGVRDLLPAETPLWNHVEQTAHAVFGTFGFSEIRLPIFEPTELFARSIGLDTDVVSKEMYTFEDRDESMISLRPEATASVCRAYIEHNMQQLPQPVKLSYMGPMFRRERPQKGRYRQFYQIGAEVLGGNDSPGIDAEVIDMVMTFFDKLELQGLELDINSIGCRECRPKYVEVLRDALIKVKDKLGPDSQRRIETNPLRVLDSKLPNEQEIIATLPRMAEHLCAECAEHFAEVKRQLELRGVIYRENWRLVRGLDYYMRTTFEITAQGLGSQNAVCGGGRYDGLVELLGGPPTKGIGFAIGEDRLILSLQESGKAPAPTGPEVYVAWMGEKAFATAIRAAKDLRAAGFRVELPATEQKFGKALGQADKLGARYALVLGEDEVSSGGWTLKTLADGSQKKYTESDLLEYLRETKPAAQQGT